MQEGRPAPLCADVKEHKTIQNPYRPIDPLGLASFPLWSSSHKIFNSPETD